MHRAARALRLAESRPRQRIVYLFTGEFNDRL
jgi:hypothetical protein